MIIEAARVEKTGDFPPRRREETLSAASLRSAATKADELKKRCPIE
jgi:hypothetical protein